MSAGYRATPGKERRSFLEVLRVFFRLGVTSFGGPVAHLGYFRDEFVERRWLDEAAYTDIFALCQFLPGPASSQVGIFSACARRFARRALRLGSASPCLRRSRSSSSPMASAASATYRRSRGCTASRSSPSPSSRRRFGAWRESLPRSGARDARGRGSAARPWPFLRASGQIGAIVAGGVIGWRFLPQQNHASAAPLVDSRRSRDVRSLRSSCLLALLDWVAVARNGEPPITPSRSSISFYRSGALVFGGGHVVLPLLQQAVVPPGWISNDAFLAGYGAAQAVPGPLFTFAAYLGAAMGPAPNGWLGGLICLARDLPAVLSPADRRAAVLGRALRHRPGCNRRSKASMRLLSAFCLRRFTRRSGRARFSARRISGLAFSPSCFWCSGERRPGWW